MQVWNKKVEARTKELHRTVHLLKRTNEELQESYFAAIPVFSSLVELQENSNVGHSKRVAEHAHELATLISLNDADARQVYFAGLLHDIGKIGFSGGIGSRPYSALTAEERQEFEKHTYMGQAALMALKPLEQAATLIRSHHERFDGKGYPDGLAGEDIPVGARILAVTNDYDSLRAGMLLEEPFNGNEARDFLRSHRGERYDPKIVDAFVELLKKQDQRDGRAPEKKVTAKDLREGMKLSKDLVNSQGLLLLSQGQRLSEALIEKLRSLEMQGEKCFVIHVNQEQGDGGK